MNYAEADDRALVRAFQDGDEKAFDEVVRRYQRQVANIIFLTLGSRRDVEDLVQESFMRVHKSLGRVEVETSLFSWLYRIAVNMSIDEMRRRKIKRALSLDFLADTSDKEPALRDAGSASDAVFQAEKEEQVLAALRKLPATYKTVLILREYEDLSYREIAETLKITEQAVKSRIFRAREVMKEFLKEYFEERQ